MKKQNNKETIFQFNLDDIMVTIESQKQYNAYKEFIKNDDYIYIRIGDVSISKMVNFARPSSGEISIIASDKTTNGISKVITVEKLQALNDHNISGLPDIVGSVTLMNKDRHFITFAKDQYGDELAIEYQLEDLAVLCIKIYKQDQIFDVVSKEAEYFGIRSAKTKTEYTVKGHNFEDFIFETSPIESIDYFPLYEVRGGVINMIYEEDKTIIDVSNPFEHCKSDGYYKFEDNTNSNEDEDEPDTEEEILDNLCDALNQLIDKFQQIQNIKKTGVSIGPFMFKDEETAAMFRFKHDVQRQTLLKLLMNDDVICASYNSILISKNNTDYEYEKELVLDFNNGKKSCFALSAKSD